MNLNQEAIHFVDLLKKCFGEELISVVLFGSVARGEAKEDSDIDLLVVFESLPEGRYARRKILEPVFEKYAAEGGRAFHNCHLKTAEEAKKITVMYFDFPQEAQLLFDRDGFFKKIIQNVETHIQKTGAKRKKWGQFYYWDLKPGGRADQVFEIL